ncbi:MAG: ATP-binding cassette domain-containing protein, partial [Clostridia bacterium]
DIMFGPKNMGLAQDDILRRAMSAAKFCGLDEEVLQSSPFEISGGQKRRAALAGVIAMEPDVLVLDEPAAGLDPRGRDDILGGITSFQKEVKNTMLLISHSMEDIARYADNILVLKNGKVFMSGTVENIFSEAIKIFDAGLDLPQITKLFIELQKRGVVDRTDIFTVAYAKKVLEQKIKI